MIFFSTQLHYLRLPKDIKDYHIFLMDATVATGAAAMMAIRVLLDHDVPEENITLCSLLMAESGESMRENMLHCSCLNLVSTCRTGYTARGCPDTQFYGAHTRTHATPLASTQTYPTAPQKNKKDPKVFFRKHHFICKVLAALLHQSSGAVWKLRWPSWAPLFPNSAFGLCGRKATLNDYCIELGGHCYCVCIHHHVCTGNGTKSCAFVWQAYTLLHTHSPSWRLWPLQSTKRSTKNSTYCRV